MRYEPKYTLLHDEDEELEHLCYNCEYIFTKEDYCKNCKLMIDCPDKEFFKERYETW